MTTMVSRKRRSQSTMLRWGRCGRAKTVPVRECTCSLCPVRAVSSTAHADILEGEMRTPPCVACSVKQPTYSDQHAVHNVQQTTKHTTCNIKCATGRHTHHAPLRGHFCADLDDGEEAAVDGRIEPALMEMNSGACFARTVASNFLMLAHIFNIRDGPRSIQRSANSTQHTTYRMQHGS